MKIRLGVVCLVAFFLSGMTVAQVRSVLLLDRDWKFKNSEVEQGAKPSFDDNAWEKVRVPHDWAILGDFDMNLDTQMVQVVEDGEKVPRLRTGRTGALPMFGVGWYRNVLPVTSADRDKRVFVEFDGAMSLAKVYLNGNFVGEWPYGYASFSFDLTSFIQFDKPNVLAVRLENRPESSRWYAGAGIFRNVRLVKTATTYVPQWGTFITTPKVTAKAAEINIQTELVSADGKQLQVRLVTDIFTKSGVKVASVSSKQAVQNKALFTQKTTIKNPALWSLKTPHLYTAISKVYVDNILKDEYKTTFGCRNIRFDKDKGFFLNDKHVKLQGVCMHHDLGPLGAAVNYRATERQVAMMKEMGANAIRTSHNPPSPELVQICDSMGMLLQVEAFDEWKYGKNKNGYHLYFDEWAERDIRSMVKRDRNHPSVIMWSIGNEIREQGIVREGKEIAGFLAKICREEDPIRPVTAGFNNHTNAISNGLADKVDLVGFNYKPYDYKKKKDENPGYVIYGSETASTVSSRGEYKFPAKEIKSPWYTDYHVSSYDLEYPRWASTPDTEFEMQDDNDFVLGEFVWTGFDYLGEPTPYNEGTPAKSSYFGIVDLGGLKKDRFYLYQSKWSETPVLHLLPHWNWPDRVGQNVPVYCYTNYPKAELFVNGKSMGVKQKDKSNKYTRYRLMWDEVVYQPGEIKVVAYNDKNEAVAEQLIKTAGEAMTLKLTADRSTIHSGGKDLSFVTVEVLDKDGNVCPRAGNLLFFDVKGAGKLKALCNGDPTDQTSFGSNYMRAFNGKMVAVIESDDNAGEIVLHVSGGLLKSQSVGISVK
ncbi:MAG: beta-galactosidase GalB [Paludibacter sp.]|nr:beta-galactosidase GalB [Paludibacter sp.]